MAQGVHPRITGRKYANLQFPSMSYSSRSSIYLCCLIHTCCFCSELVTGCLVAERMALLQFRSSLNDTNNGLSSWGGNSCCSWNGVSCDGQTGSITGIDLSNISVLALSGKIDPSLLQLKSLKLLDFSFIKFDGIPIPHFFGSLSELRFLSLNNAGFSGAVPPQLGNLSKLQHLDLSSTIPRLVVGDFQWVRGLSSLEFLAMNFTDTSRAGSELFQALNSLSSLRELHMPYCKAAGIAATFSFINLTSLRVMDLSYNNFNSMIPSWFSNLSSLVILDLQNASFHGQIPKLSMISSLKHIDLSNNYDLVADIFEFLGENWMQVESINLGRNKVHGLLPDSIGNLTSLVDLDLSYNKVEGGIPRSIGRICSLKSLILDDNNLTLGLPKSLEVEGCSSDKPLQNLEVFSIAENNITGSLPEWLGELKNLIVLDLKRNKLNDTLLSTLGYLSKLEFLCISSNNLAGTLDEETFSNFSKLTTLCISSNSFIVNVSSSWVPPFKLGRLEMSSCQLDTQFPSWLKTQVAMTVLDISNNSISGMIPSWFWDLCHNIYLFNISFNNLEGEIPNLLNFESASLLDLSNNLFTGSIPISITSMLMLDLSHNHFSGTIPSNFFQQQPFIFFLSLAHNNLSGTIPSLIGDLPLSQIINLSNNYLSGSIPSSLQNCSKLVALSLEQNNLTGFIPHSLGSLVQLRTLHLNDNGLSGLIPESFQNYTSLEALDLGNNNLSGSIPAWLGEKLSALRILRLRSNKFTGKIPSQLSNLQYLQVIDLADNHLSGAIPQSLGAMKAMNTPFKLNIHALNGDNYYISNYYKESISVTAKNLVLTYDLTLSLLTAIDLSRNMLSGEIPPSLASLSGLMFLSLSENILVGKIPTNISGIRELESLDLSSNHFSGEIPITMASLTSLGYLNLSNNNFSGEIPFRGQLSTFSLSAFSGNPFLCGRPLSAACEKVNTIANEDDNEDAGDGPFYLSAGLGFAVGLLGLLAAVSIRKPWCDAYFEFIDLLVKIVTRSA